jgi:dipeptidyl aminopeptidase/acylaminoacyl peptidase
MSKKIQPYGTWPGVISPRAMAGMLTFNDVQWDNGSDTLVWLEGRGDKGVLVAQCGTQAARDLTADLSVRAKVGYGGGNFTVAHGNVYFAGPGGRLYKQSLKEGSACPITPAFGELASPAMSSDGKWVVFVHTYEHSDGLDMVDSSGANWPRKLAYGTDFVMQPTWHPEGEYIAYIAWNHPQMPWDGTELRLITLEYDRAGAPSATLNETIAGNTETAVFQPEFSPDGRFLAYISDKTGWNQLYCYDITHKTHTQLTSDEAEHGAPAWIQGIRVYGWRGDSQSIIYTRSQQGFASLWEVKIGSGKSTRLTAFDGYTDFDQIATAGDAVAVIASSGKISPRVISRSLESPIPPSLSLPGTEPPSIQVIVNDEAGETIHRRSGSESIPAAQLAEAKAISWKSHDGGMAHGLYYATSSDEYQGIGAPPLIVQVHGGPTSQVTAGYHGVVQFFASRGYALLMVNYRGSTGYGREYMNKLRGSWGIYDVEDSASGASYLAAEGLADASRFVILGGSAGGFTVLQSLVEKPGFYKAGVCLFGVSNQFGLAMETHKFEERYTDSLLGPLPEAAELYRARSPLFHAQKIVDPIIVFQGEDDVVVPRNQSDTIVASLKARNIPHEYHVYAGEGHGWRKPETIEHYYEAVVKFLKQYVIFS